MNTETIVIQTPTLYNISKETMTSLEIAEITGKQHSNVMRDIRSMVDNIKGKFTSELASDYHRSERNQYKYLSDKTADYLLNFCKTGNKQIGGYEITESTYNDSQGKERSLYILNKKACFLLASGYDVLLRAKIIDRWEELETEKRNGGFIVPQSFSEALMLAAKQQFQIEENEKKIAALNEEQERLLVENTKKDETINEQGEQIIKLTSDISQMQPKVDYCDIILQSNSTVLVTQIAQDYGYSAVSFNKKLAELKIQHRVNNQWILYAPYLAMGYVQSKPVNIPLPDGSTKVRLNTEWTQKGRLFLYEKLKANNIVPLIER